nr:MAG TPA: Radical SAM superfamily [Caudoviricetes sp.]
MQVITSRIPGTFPPGCPMKCEFNDRNRAKGGKENTE